MVRLSGLKLYLSEMKKAGYQGFRILKRWFQRNLSRLGKCGRLCMIGWIRGFLNTVSAMNLFSKNVMVLTRNVPKTPGKTMKGCYIQRRPLLQ